MSDHETTLRELAVYHDQAPSWRAACLAGADALRPCGTCQQWKPAGKRRLCERFRCFTTSDDGCIKGYAPTEPTR